MTKFVSACVEGKSCSGVDGPAGMATPVAQDAKCCNDSAAEIEDLNKQIDAMLPQITAETDMTKKGELMTARGKLMTKRGRFARSRRSAKSCTQRRFWPRSPHPTP